ncbi:MAG: aminotransferase class V-fold PLP-dependent enzyme, partial [Saprospiraceae bacterium]|nr:aminotransferase class V-fold PLP-dependent enzyme [Saprospiraceae bacterium]
MSQYPIYFDNNATTPADPAVIEAMIPFFHDRPGNAASRHHHYGWMAEEAVDEARQKVAALIGADTGEIVFTSGATESDNLALKGVFEMYHRKGRHIVTVKTEHNAVLDCCRQIEKKGGEVTYLDVDPSGRIDLEQLEQSIRKDTVLVSIMWVNNETGVIQPMKEIGR